MELQARKSWKSLIIEIFVSFNHCQIIEKASQDT